MSIISDTSGVLLSCSLIISVIFVIYRIYIGGKKSAYKNNVDYALLEEGDLIVVSAPGYHHVAIFKSKSECGTHFKADLFDFNQDISVRDKVLTRLQFRGKV